VRSSVVPAEAEVLTMRMPALRRVGEAEGGIMGGWLDMSLDVQANWGI